MKAKLIVEGKEFDIEIQDPELQKLVAPPKKTGYERVDREKEMYYQHADGRASIGYDYYNKVADVYYNSANYYSSKAVAENNARADKLMRQLRRFAVERREFADSSHTSFKNERWLINYDYKNSNLFGVRSEMGARQEITRTVRQDI